MVEINSEMENVVDLDGKLRATILSTWILNEIQCGLRNKGREKRKNKFIYTNVLEATKEKSSRNNPYVGYHQK